MSGIGSSLDARLGERIDTSIFCSSAVKSNRSISELSQPQICVTPYTEQIKDVQSENQAIDNVRSPDEEKRTRGKSHLRL